MSETWDAAGFIASSRYRLAVCKYLLEGGPGLPSEIAADTDLAQPHVSRALSELRERDVVELLVPESQQKGRLYDLTERGHLALTRLERGREALDVTIVQNGGFPHEELVDFLKTSYERDVEAVAAFDDGHVDVYFFGESPPDPGSAPVVTLWQDSTQIEFADSTDSEHDFTVYGLTDLTLVRIHVDDESHVGISFDEEADITVRRFIEECEQRV